ncbi:uncharacterized protein LOC111028646 [Myzus persicae]|uniref:uncharacterized protein LOC111028646 n=1 Tax=Myzus persicae TaxID=13164 RepID=UPI000B932AF6|nr:uncharacterized protein LOC111028646 [Myzus persicae]
MLSIEEDDYSVSRAADEDRGIEEFLTQVTWAPTKSLNIDVSTNPPTRFLDTLPPYFDPENFVQPPPWYSALETSTALDENDGPTSFNHSPSILDFTGGKPTKKRNAKRKLFE